MLAKKTAMEFAVRCFGHTSAAIHHIDFLHIDRAQRISISLVYIQLVLWFGNDGVSSAVPFVNTILMM